MEWTECLKRAIAYMEAHLLEEDVAAGAAETVHVSAFYLQRGSKLLTGYSMGEYVRCRRLYLAGLDVIAGRGKILDLALRYGYDTPESFTKAFRRFHGVPPVQLRQTPERLRSFLPLKITLSMQGGDNMDCTIEKMDSFSVIGMERMFSVETSYQEIPKFWDEFLAVHCAPFWAGKPPESALEQAVCQCNIGEFGVCVDTDGGRFRYLIAGRYDGRAAPEGLTVLSFPALTWAKFRCSGPMPDALQAVNTQIFQEWLPGNPDYELSYGANVEWYSLEGKTSDPDYESAIWVPVQRRD